MTRPKSKERVFCIRVSKGPFCPNDLYEEVKDKMVEIREHSYSSFIHKFPTFFEVGYHTENNPFISPELLLDCVKGDVDDLTNHRHLSSLFNYEIFWYNNNDTDEKTKEEN